MGLLALACASSGGLETGSEPAAGEVVHFEFAWPEGLVAAADAWVVTREGRSLRYGFDLHTEEEGDRLWLRHDAFRVEVPDEAGRFVPVPSGSQVAGMISSLQPDFLVDPDGALRRVDDAGAAAIVDAALAREPVGETSLQQAQSRQLLTQIATMRQSERAQEIWYALVEFWVGHAYELESIYELEIEQGLEGRPEMSEDFIGELEVGGWIPCPTRTSEPRCVELSLTSRLADPDPDRLAQRLGALAREFRLSDLSPEAMQLLEGPSASDFIVEYDQRWSVRLVCEPDGLIPHELEHRTVKQIELAIPNHGRERLNRIRESTYRFRYGNESGRDGSPE